MVGVEIAEERDELRIELRAGMPAELVDRCLVGHRPLVRPVVDHRVVRVGDRDNPGSERDVVPAQPERVAMTRIAFVVVEDDRNGVLEGGGLLEDHLSDPRMLHDGPPLGCAQRGRLVEDVRRQTDLAHVVKQGRRPNALHLRLGEVEVLGHRDHDRCNQRRGLAAVVGER